MAHPKIKPFIRRVVGEPDPAAIPLVLRLIAAGGPITAKAPERTGASKAGPGGDGTEQKDPGSGGGK